MPSGRGGQTIRKNNCRLSGGLYDGTRTWMARQPIWISARSIDGGRGEAGESNDGSRGLPKRSGASDLSGRHKRLQYHTLGRDNGGAEAFQGTAVPSTPHPVVPQRLMHRVHRWNSGLTNRNSVTPQVFIVLVFCAIS
jgi:hypothetical protein